jgi:hypothetical protein
MPAITPILDPARALPEGDSTRPATAETLSLVSFVCEDEGLTEADAQVLLRVCRALAWRGEGRDPDGLGDAAYAIATLVDAERARVIERLRQAAIEYGLWEQ